MALSIDQTEKIKLEKERKKRQHQLTEALLNAQENEAAALSKEFHDNTNQMLTTTRLFVERGSSDKMKHEDVFRLKYQYRTKAIDEIRKLSQILMPPELTCITLEHTLNDLIKLWHFQYFSN